MLGNYHNFMVPSIKIFCEMIVSLKVNDQGKKSKLTKKTLIAGKFVESNENSIWKWWLNESHYAIGQKSQKQDNSFRKLIFP